MNNQNSNPYKNDHPDSPAEYLKDGFVGHLMEKQINKTGFAQIKENTTTNVGHTVKNAFNRHTQRVANSAFNRHYNQTPPDLKGGALAKSSIENSVIRSKIGSGAVKASKGFTSTAVAAPISIGIDLSLARAKKGNDLSKVETRKVVGTSIGGTVISIVAGIGIGAAVSLGVIPALGLTATAAVGITVGAIASGMNDVLVENVAPIGHAEYAIGDAVVSTYDGAKDFVSDAYNNTIPATNTLKNIVGHATGVVASAGKVLVDTKQIQFAITKLQAAKTPLHEMKHENDEILKHMNNDFERITRRMRSMPHITGGDVNEVVAKHHLRVHQNVNESAINASNRDIEKQIQTINHLISGLKRTAAHAQSQDSEWSQRFQSLLN